MTDFRQERMYVESRKDLWDNYSVMKTAHDKGVLEGLAEGEKRKSHDIACKMIAKGMSVDDVSEMTGLSKEELLK